MAVGCSKRGSYACALRRFISTGCGRQRVALDRVGAVHRRPHPFSALGPRLGPRKGVDGSLGTT